MQNFPPSGLNTEFNHFFFDDEAQRRLDRYAALERGVNTLRLQMGPKDDAAFYQLVYYPVVAASLMNKKFLYRDKANFYARQNRLSAAGYARMAQATYDSILLETDHYNNRLSGGKWKNMLAAHLLANAKSQIISSDEKQLVMDYHYLPNSPKGESIAGKVAYNFTDSSYININYDFKGEGKGMLPDAGISFLIPASLTEFRWIGKGPYEAYPGKDKLSEFGFYHVNSKDLYFPGNRQEVDCALFTDAGGMVLRSWRIRQTLP